MSTIKILSEEVITGIAAGQVIERPASVVKELVDNALDAGANIIEIAIEKGGLQRITVTDNGKGMSPEDVMLCFLPHATSKISTLSDLTQLQTVGFRGEGLASMAAVSTIILSTRTKKDAYGSQVTISKGIPSVIKPIGMPVGTRVSVSQLFAHLPARKKYIKKEQTEFRYILKMVAQYLLAYPQLTFTLTHNNKRIWHVASQTMSQRIKAVTGFNREQMIAIKKTDDHVQIKGFIGLPQLAQRTQPEQYLFINNRAVQYPEIQKIIKESYATLLEPYAQPAYVMNIIVPPHMVDTNIDPKKEKAHLYNLKTVIQTLYETIHSQLQKKIVRYTVGDSDYELADAPMELITATALKKMSAPWSLKNIKRNQEIFQFHNTYLVAQTETGIIMFDQHAAHERILYEQYLDVFQKEKIEKKIALSEFKKEYTLTHLEQALIEEYVDGLKAHGFQFSIVQKKLIVTKIPQLFAGRNIKMFFLELCEDFKELMPNEKIDVVSHKTIAYIACRSAIKAGEVLTQKERFNLLKKLSQTKTQYTCPHGRPVQLTVSLHEIEKMFHRR